ncbi:MAG: Quinoprotein glucose dehydrogenase B precursor [Alphaproteobacteria bacterium ADurb.BinA280]|jgi:glucose/arabinose dehydrogenase|nr:MAG: Quinoprotein glucose dehydrogenase B precursor [Alphaproteobacteria bacterium ADurb.BinA280]
MVCSAIRRCASVVWCALISGLACSVALAQPAQPAQFESWISSGLSSPIGLTHAGDGSGRQFIIQQSGAVRVVRNGVLQGTPLLTVGTGFSCTYPGDVSATSVGFVSGGEQGLLGLAFHPQFESNGRLFLSISDSAGDTMMVRFAMSNPAADVMSAGDLQSCTVILRADQDFTNHNGGNIVFGPDGYLYLGLGDGGSGGDPCSRAQTLDPSTLVNTGSSCPADATYSNNGGDPQSRALLGKMLRLDADGTTAAGSGLLCGRPRMAHSAEYAIPPSQPGAATGSISSACDEVWAYGLRNPWRFSFDVAGNMIIGDVGQNQIEEIDFEPANTGGRNYGWRCREGASTFNSGTPYCNDPLVTATFIEPVLTYTHGGGGCSVTGGFRYRGEVLATRGKYFFGDYCTGEVWTSTPGTPWSTAIDFGAALGFGLTSFGEDEVGELYMLHGSTIYRLNGARGLFYDGFE